MKSIFNKLKKGLGLEEEQDQEVQEEQKDQKEAAPKTSFIPATPVKRDAIIKFIIQALKPYVDEKGMWLAGLRLYVSCNNQEQEEAARVALCTDKPGMFKTDYLGRRLVNHFIQLSPDWFFECHVIREELPENCIVQENFGLKVVRAGERITDIYSKATIQVLSGQAEQNEYTLDPHQQVRFNIGRSKNPKLSSGKIQLNDIVFLAKEDVGFNEATGSANLHVSRNHAYIVYDPKADQYFIYPDKGGLPDNGNKIKIHTADDKIKWLNIYGVGHALQPGDQIELGGEAILRFTKP